jgi:hypothetical protein
MQTQKLIQEQLAISLFYVFRGNDVDESLNYTRGI